jgi:hypothetical protein
MVLNESALASLKIGVTIRPLIFIGQYGFQKLITGQIHQCFLFLQGNEPVDFSI